MNTSPFVLKNAIDSWPAARWTPEILADVLDGKTTKIRLGSKTHKIGSILWETDCEYVDATLSDLISWQNDEKFDENNPLKSFDRTAYWAYVDYKYMFELFDDLTAVDWSIFGFENRDGLESTFWLGTRGAYTPCHYDTYGFNLVAQIYGRKRWTLFPPEDDLAATRFPYEESSVFASLDLVTPVEENMRGTRPRVVVLEPGDVLFVPPKWWHFVQSISDWTISVNTWVDEPENDRTAKPLEALTRTIVALFNASSESGDVEKMIIDQSKSSTEFLRDSMAILNEVAPLKFEEEACDFSENKKRRLESDNAMMKFVERFQSVGTEVKPMTCVEDYCRYMRENCVLKIADCDVDFCQGKSSCKIIEKKDILEAITHPDCISVIYDRLMKVRNKK